MTQLRKWRGISTVWFILVTAQKTPIENLTVALRERKKKLYKLWQTEAMQLVVCPAGRHYRSPITISQRNYHHKTRHIYTYSSELILTHIHHCQHQQNMMMGMHEQYRRWSAEIHKQQRRGSCSSSPSKQKQLGLINQLLWAGQSRADGSCSGGSRWTSHDEAEMAISVAVMKAKWFYRHPQEEMKAGAGRPRALLCKHTHTYCGMEDDCRVYLTGGDAGSS